MIVHASSRSRVPGASLPHLLPLLLLLSLIGLARRAECLPSTRRPRRRALHLVPLRAGPGLAVRRADTAWGTPRAVRRLRQLGVAFKRRFPSAGAIRVHDLSLRFGGRMRYHTSHRYGRDVDIRLMLYGRLGYINATPATLRLAETWFIIKWLAKTCDVEFILLDRSLQRALYRYAARLHEPARVVALLLEYPALPGHWHPARRRAAIVRHFRNHANHMHVRFRGRRRTAYYASRALCGGTIGAKARRARPKTQTGAASRRPRAR